MAIEIKITKELGNYEPKLIGPFTNRNVVCIGLAVLAGSIPYKILTPIVGVATARWAFLPFGFLAFVFGFYKPYGMATEKFLKSVFVNRVLAPTKRKYKCVNTTEELINIYSKAALEEQSALEEPTKKPKKKVKPAKYKLSKKAIK